MRSDRNRTARSAGLAAAGAAVALVALCPAARASDAHPPYHDPGVDGHIGLCDQEGHQITSGSLLSQPFVWRAVSSTPAPKAYTGRVKATLYAYTPVEGEDPGLWNGDQLTGSSSYSEPQAPTVQATGSDTPLISYVQLIPPRWDGYIQLRFVYTSVPSPAYTGTYPSADIQVSGDTWRQVGSTKVDCDSGTAVSDESILDERATRQAPRTIVTTGRGADQAGAPGNAAGSAADGSKTATSQDRAGSGTARDPAPHGTTAEAASASTGGGSGASVGVIASIAGAVAAAAAGTWYLLRRRAGRQSG